MNFNAIEEIEFNMDRKILVVNWFPREGPGCFLFLESQKQPQADQKSGLF